MSRGGWYAAGIAVSFLAMALAVVGVRWHALAGRETQAAALTAQDSVYGAPRTSAAASPGAATTPAAAAGSGAGPSQQSPSATDPSATTPLSPSAASQTASIPPGAAKPKGKSYGKKVLPAEHSVELNSASAGELQRLPGIGPAMASRIVDYRRDHPFKSVDELDNVKGIGPKKLAKIEPYVFVR